jgi:hypothetical protein
VCSSDLDSLWVECAERRSISQHLQELVAAGRAACVAEGRFALA